MSCHGCSDKFSFFHRELSCSHCGFSFCKKCLKGEVKIGEKQQKVCKSCESKAMGSDTMKTQVSDPPALLLKRLETLENPAKPPITIFKQKTRLINLKYGLEPKDRQILERLEKLRENRKAQNRPSEAEIKRRLLILKGMNEDNVEDRPVSLKQSKTVQEEVDELLNCIINESRIEENINNDSDMNLADIEERLHKLKTSENGVTYKSNVNVMELENTDYVSKKLIEKAIAEGKMEKKLECGGEKSSGEEDSSTEELDDCELCCIICNEDATLKCLSCESSLYCKTCFQQGHEYFEMNDHKTMELIDK